MHEPTDLDRLGPILRNGGETDLSALADASGLDPRELRRLAAGVAPPATADEVMRIATALQQPVHRVVFALWRSGPELALAEALTREALEHGDAEIQALQSELTRLRHGASTSTSTSTTGPPPPTTPSLEDAARSSKDDPDADHRPTPDTKLPPMRKMAGGLALAAGRGLLRAARGLPVLADQTTAQRRREICATNACGRYLADRDRCAECGCFVSAKVRLVSERCPLGLWGGELEAAQRPAAAHTGGAEDEMDREIEPGPEATPDLVENAAASRADATHGVGLARAHAPATSLTPPDSRFSGIVLFSHSECGACTAVDAVVRQVEHDLGRAVDVRTIDVRAHPELADRYGVRAVPTLLVYDRSELAARLEGLPHADELHAALAGRPASELTARASATTVSPHPQYSVSDGSVELLHARAELSHLMGVLPTEDGGSPPLDRRSSSRTEPP